MLVFSAEPSSTDVNLDNSSVDVLQYCSSKEFVGENCEDIKAIRGEIDSTYDKYVSWCNELQLTPENINTFTQNFMGCVKELNSADNPNSKPMLENGCDPKALLYSYFVGNPEDKVGINFEKFYASYQDICRQIGKEPAPSDSIKAFLVSQKMIEGVRVVTEGDSDRVYGLSIVNQPAKNSTKDQTNIDSSLLGGLISIFNNTTFLIIVIIAILILIVIVIIVSFFLLKKKQNDIINEMKAVREKMIALERTYLKGKLDESTYRKLMQQYQLRLTELELEIARLKKKQEKITKEQKEESN